MIYSNFNVPFGLQCPEGCRRTPRGFLSTEELKIWEGTQSVATSGTQVVGPLTATMQYELRCWGHSGHATVVVNEVVSKSLYLDPKIHMTVSPTSLTGPGSVTISYWTLHATYCYLEPGGTLLQGGGSPVNRLKQVVTISATTTFTMHCVNGNLNASKSVTVPVL